VEILWTARAKPVERLREKIFFRSFFEQIASTPPVDVAFVPRFA
jgi:hypothetical protein